ncbi:hypothetical protein S23_27590 [Bradyrhizobium cosmicum]|uniref:Uncharacterized protein n=1 Tax=Bradyrhizobium cosmicum TaxID=1404864 RepID=A0AAI8QC31_9BRAD|nr:hypothetical protein S23_27590 [Bradyrhizobium cosmicum]
MTGIIVELLPAGREPGSFGCADIGPVDNFSSVRETMPAAEKQNSSPVDACGKHPSALQFKGFWNTGTDR